VKDFVLGFDKTGIYVGLYYISHNVRKIYKVLTTNEPSGVTNGKINVEYTYTSGTTDPEGDQVYYLWDWGDGNNSGWLGPYNSGVPCEAKHIWNVKDNYNIKVKAKDIYGKESS